MTKIIILIVLLMVGYFAGRVFQSKRGKEIIKNFLVYIGLPSLLLYSILSEGTIEFGLISGIVVFSLVLNIALSQLGNKILKLQDRGVLILLNSFPNSGFLGLPLCWILFGELGLYYGSLYVLVGTLIHYTLGIGIALQSESNQIKKSIKAIGRWPGIWALTAVLLIIISGINLPFPIMKGLGYIGKITLGLAIFYIGLNLEKPRSLKEFSSQCLYVGVFRFLISPLIIVIPLILLGSKSWIILGFEAMMPPAIVNTVIAKFYGLNEKLSANITAILTIIFLAIFFILSWFLI